ncbi:UNVERIFIED_CONTAM: hypothetical protein K2H54_061115 [Gekko kuhli]
MWVTGDPGSPPPLSPFQFFLRPLNRPGGAHSVLLQGQSTQDSQDRISNILNTSRDPSATCKGEEGSRHHCLSTVAPYLPTFISSCYELGAADGEERAEKAGPPLLSYPGEGGKEQKQGPQWLLLFLASTAHSLRLEVSSPIFDPGGC